jgi:hypothetical protein
MNLPPVSLADLLRASRAASDKDARNTSTSTSTSSSHDIAPTAGFVGCDLGAFFRSEIESSPATRSSPPPDLFALPHTAPGTAAASRIPLVPFILMAQLKLGTMCSAKRVEAWQ